MSSTLPMIQPGRPCCALRPLERPRTQCAFVRLVCGLASVVSILLCVCTSILRTVPIIQLLPLDGDRGTRSAYTSLSLAPRRVQGPLHRPASTTSSLGTVLPDARNVHPRRVAETPRPNGRAKRAVPVLSLFPTQASFGKRDSFFSPPDLAFLRRDHFLVGNSKFCARQAEARSRASASTLNASQRVGRKPVIGLDLEPLAAVYSRAHAGSAMQAPAVDDIALMMHTGSGRGGPQIADHIMHLLIRHHGLASSLICYVMMRQIFWSRFFGGVWEVVVRRVSDNSVALEARRTSTSSSMLRLPVSTLHIQTDRLKPKQRTYRSPSPTRGHTGFGPIFCVRRKGR